MEPQQPYSIEELKIIREHLRKDCAKLKREIIDLGRKPTNKVFTEIGIEEEDSKNENIVLEHRELTELIDLSQPEGLKISCGAKLTLDKNTLLYHGDGQTEYINFQYKLTVLKSQPMKIKDIQILIENEEVKEVLKTWLKEYAQQGEFQLLLQGIVGYSNLLSEMYEILSSLKSSLNHLFEVDLGIRGCTMKSKRKYEESDTPILVVYWTISWKENTRSMSHKFTFEISDTGMFKVNDLKLWEEMSLHTTTFSAKSLRGGLISVLDAVSEV